MDRHVGLTVTIALFFVGLTFCVGYLVIEDDLKDLKHQAIERGYALYCPRNGQFAWKGECEEEEE